MICRAKNFEGWIRANFDNSELQEIAQWGCVNGFHDLTYYSDTCHLYKVYKSDIWELVNQGADEQGVNVLEFIANLNNAQLVSTSAHFENLLVWFAAELVACELTAEREG